MDVRIVTPSHDQWNMILPPPQTCHSTFEQDTVGKFPVQELYSSAHVYSARFAPPHRNTARIASAPLEFLVTRNRSSSEFSGPFCRPSHLDPTDATDDASITSVLDRFSKSLSLAANEIPSTQPEKRCNQNRHLDVVEDKQRITLESTIGALDVHTPETTKPFVRSPRPLNSADIQPSPTSLFTDTEYLSPGSRLAARVHPLAHPRPPTPPISRHRKPTLAARRTQQDRLEVFQANIQASKHTQWQTALRLLPDRRYDVEDEDEARRKVRNGRRRVVVPVTPNLGRHASGGRHGREQPPEEECRNHTPRKWTRFVMPDDPKEHRVGEDPVARLSNAHRHTRRVTRSGPLRSILRNKNAPVK